MKTRRHSLRGLAAAALVALGGATAWAFEWGNIDEDHYVAGRRCSAGYLRGKVAMVCRDPELAPRLEEIWTSFKTKPFILIGSYEQAPKDVSFPIYNGVHLVDKPIAEPIFVVDETRAVRYRGKDERRATEVLVTLLTDMEAPKTDKQWRKFLDYEFAELPGRAYLRYEAYRKAFPKSAKDYEPRFDELARIPDVKALAELVKFSKSVKDLRAVSPKKAEMIKPRLIGKIDSAISRYASLKESENPLVVQEAKNSLADLAWAKAGL